MGDPIPIRLLMARGPVLDRKGRIGHNGGVVEEAPGMYLIGADFLRRCSSSLIHGAGQDAEDLSTHLDNYLRDKKSPCGRR